MRCAVMKFNELRVKHKAISFFSFYFDKNANKMVLLTSKQKIVFWKPQTPHDVYIMCVP